MKFCKYCGAQLEDNAVCTCEKSRAAAAAQQQYVQPSPQPQQYQQPQQFGAQPPQYGTPAQPFGAPGQPSPYAVKSAAPDGAFVKGLKNVPVIFVSFWKNSKAVIDAAKNGKDYIVACIYTFVFFLMMMFNNMFFMIKLYGLHFGKTLLAALVMTVLIGGLYSLVLFAYTKKYNPGVPTAKAFVDAFITFAIESIPVSISLLVGGLFALIYFPFAVIFFVIDVIYLAVSLALNVKNVCGDAVKNHALFNLLLAVCIAAAFLIIAFIGFWITLWSHNYSAVIFAAIEQIKEGFSSLSSYTSSASSLSSLFS